MKAKPSNGQLILSNNKIAVIEALTTKYYQVLKNDEDLRLLRREDLQPLFDGEELQVINELYSVDPTKYGFKGEYVGVDEVPTSLVKISSSKFNVNGEQLETGVHYLPKQTMNKLKLMLHAMQSDGVGSMLVMSGYRSPSYQALLFLSNLRRNEYDIRKTASKVALPGYSQHGSADSPAVDFMTTDGIPNAKSPVGFETTKQYKWLSRHARDFDFYLSYPEDNPHGVIFEPWHWRHMPKS
jgi:LAS superfamily LD-carboxypeptidase LdcB